MDRTTLRSLLGVAAVQHGVVARHQLLALGLGRNAIAHRLAAGVLHPVGRGVYAVGRPELTREGIWTAALLACGDRAALSHGSAGALWDVARQEGTAVHVSVPDATVRVRPGVVVHRRTVGAAEVTVHRGIRVTTPGRTLVDLALVLSPERLEAAVNAADRLDLIDPERLRRAIGPLAGMPGVRPLRALLDRRTFRLTDSALERLFLPLVRRAGLPEPRTRARVCGFRADFFWPTLGLVVETDGLRYHRTASQQARDRRRDQTHTAAGLTPLRFTHDQVRHEPEHVVRTLAATAARLGG